MGLLALLSASDFLRSKIDLMFGFEFCGLVISTVLFADARIGTSDVFPLGKWSLELLIPVGVYV